MKRTIGLLTPFALLTVAACSGGGLSGNLDKPSTLATVKGQIKNPASLSIGDKSARLAVVWADVDAKSVATGVFEAQDAPVTAQFPASYQLDISEPPPVTSVAALGGTSSSFGSLVLYEDLNGNDKLDLVDPTATAYVDHALAVSTGLVVYYVQSQPADPAARIHDDNGAVAALGFNLMRFDACAQQGTCGSAPGYVFEAISTPVDLTLSDDPSIALKMCKTDPGVSYGSGSPVQHDASALPSGLVSGGYTCASSTEVDITACGSPATVTTVCQAIPYTCSTDAYLLAPGATPPANWPCK